MDHMTRTREILGELISFPTVSADSNLALIEHLHDAPDAMPLQEQRETPALMIAATAGMVAVSVLLTVAAGPLYAYATRAGERLAAPEQFVAAVLDNPNNVSSGSGKNEIEGYDPRQSESVAGTKEAGDAS